MASIGSVVVQFLADDKMSRTVSNLTGKLKGLGTEAGKADTKSSNLGGSLKTKVAVGAGLAGGAIMALGGFLVDTAAAAIADEKESRKLAATLDSIPGVTQAAIDKNAEWIDAMELATGVADDELRPAVSKLALATGDLTEAQKLTKLAVDASAGSGKSLSTITDALAKAVGGNTTALKKHFPWLDANHDGAVTLEEAVTGLGTAYDGAAESASNTDPWSKIKTVWGQIKEQLGKWVIPLVDEFGEWFKDPKNKKAIQNITTEIGKMATKLGESLGPALEGFLKWVGKKENQQKIKDFASAIGKIASAFTTTYNALKKLSDFDPDKWILEKLGFGKGRSPGGGAGSWSATPPPAGPSTLAAAPAPAPPPIFVTEDMVAQAVSRMVMRSQGRRGRLVMVS